MSFAMLLPPWFDVEVSLVDTTKPRVCASHKSWRIKEGK
jgi:hypothetical protein